MNQKISIFIFLMFFAITAHAVNITPLEESAFERVEGFFSKVWKCKWRISCYKERLGVTITTIAATDLIRDSRAVINTNFSNLNDGKIENSSSSIAAITTLSNLVTVGTLTSGSLGSGFTTVVVGRGGTGATDLTGILAGNGTAAFGVISTSTGLADRITDETGTGVLVFGTSPTITCTGCITDANVVNTVTLTDITQITNRSITNLTTSAAAGNIYFSSGTVPTVNTVFTWNNTSLRLGVGTSTPAQTLSIQGNTLISGDLSTANLIATGTTQFGGGTYTWPSDDGNLDQVLTTNGTGGLSWTTSASAGGGNVATSAAAHFLAARTPVIAGTHGGLTVTVSTANTELSTFGSTAQPFRAQTITPTNDFLLKTLAIKWETQGSPTDNARIRIEEVNQVTGWPNGRVLNRSDSVAAANIPAATCTGNATQVNFSTSTLLYANTLYAIISERTGALDATNNYADCGSATSVYTGGNAWTNNGTVWSSATHDEQILATSSITRASSDFIFPAWGDSGSTTQATTSMVVGITTTSCNHDTTGCEFQVNGPQSGFSSLVPGANYWLAGAASGTIARSPGSAGEFIGRAVSSTTMNLLIGTASTTYPR